MPRKRREESNARISEGLQLRIENLAEMFWSSSRSRMARDLDVDQSTISKVLTRKQEPSAKFLERLAAWPGVNVVWLFTGQGEPQVQGGTRPAVGPFRPVLDDLLPGPLSEHQHRMTGISYPVAAAFDTASSYWYRVPANAPVTIAQVAVQAGDLLLMETEPGWTRKGDFVAGKFCGFRVGRGKGAVELGRVDIISKTTTFDTYEQYKVIRFAEPKEEAWLIVPANASGQKEAKRSVPGMHLALSQVACVCIKLERPLIREARRGEASPPVSERS